MDAHIDGLLWGEREGGAPRSPLACQANRLVRSPGGNLFSAAADRSYQLGRMKRASEASERMRPKHV